MPNRDTPMEEIAAALPLARAYCEPECQCTVVDADLVYAAARVLIREGWVPPEDAMAEAQDVSKQGGYNAVQDQEEGQASP